MKASAISAGSAFALFLLVAAFMILEARRAATNEHVQRARGGIEPSGDVYRLMQLAYPGIFVAMLVEGALGGGTIAGGWFVAGLAIFAAAKLLKWWAIATLGPFWTFRVIVVPGSSSVDTGPYRILTHPNYVAVVGEIVGVTMMMRAWVSGPIALVVFGTLLLRRISVENRARDAILRRG
jgi:methyltransferase